MTGSVDTAARALLVCPRDRASLIGEGPILACGQGHRYPVVSGIPVLLRDDVPETLWVHRRSLARAWEHVEGKTTDDFFLDTLGITEDVRNKLREARGDSGTVDPVVSHLLVATNGRLYRPLIGCISRYPIPELPMRPGTGRLLDIGCGWGRWCLAAAEKGYDVIGVDPSLGAALTAKRVAAELGVKASFVVADARYLPFVDGSFPRVFSYSVLQHFGAENVDRSLAEVRRVLEPGGSSCIQMANSLGIRSLLVQAGRGFRDATRFEVRYWRPRSLLRWFNRRIGPTRMLADGFFGLGVRPSDRDLLPLHYRMIVDASSLLCRASRRFPALARAADSLFLHSEKLASA